MQFIAALNNLNPKEILDIKTLKKRVMEEFAKPEFAKRAEQTRDLLGRMIFHQFPNIPIAASCEMLSNSRDAQARAGRLDKPIVMKVRNNTLDLFDQGDGMDVPGLATFLSIGRSLQPEHMYDLDNGNPNVTGRYGHGAVSIYYYLAYDWLKRTASLPAFQTHQESLSLAIQYEENGQSFEATFSILYENGKICVETKPIEKEQKDKKIRILTGKGDEAYKMVFREKDRSILVKIKPSDQKCVGTAIRVASPLVEEKQDKIAEQTEKAFRFVTKTPIEINGKGINPSSRYQKLDFDGVTLLYTPETGVRGEVAICENGRVVQEYTNDEGAEIPLDMAVSFDKLPLTSDRAIVHFEDPKTADKMRKMVQDLFDHPSIKPHEKALLLNGLYPILKADRFHLINEIKALVSKWAQGSFRLLPDTPGIRSLKIENALHLHPDYLEQIPMTPLYAKGARALYALPFQREGKIAEICTTGPSTNLFLNQDYFEAVTPVATYFNLHLLHHWCANRTAKQPEKGLLLDKEWLKSTFLPQKPVAAAENFKQFSLETYERAEGANEMVPSTYFYKMIEDKAKTVSPELSKDLLAWLAHFKQHAFHLVSKKCYHYLFDTLLAEPKQLRNFTLTSRMAAWGVNYIRDLHSFDTWYRLALKLTCNPPNDITTRMAFLTSTTVAQQAKITEDWLEGQYNRRLGLMKKAHVNETQATQAFSTHFAESLDLLEALVDKIWHPALKAIPLIGIGSGRLTDLSTLMTMPSQTLTLLLSLLPKSTTSFVWNAEDYRFLEKCIIPLRCDLNTKAKWVEVYQVSRHIMAEALPLQPSLRYRLSWNCEAFSQLLMREATEDSSHEHATAILESLKDARNNLMRYSLICEAVLPHTPQNYISAPRAPTPSVIPLPGLQTVQQSIEAIGKFLSLLFPKLQANGMHEWMIKGWETAELLPDLARPFIYAALMGNEGFLRSTNYRFDSTCQNKAVLLHEDPDVKGELGSPEVAKAAMEEAVRQARATPQYWIVELIKNSLEAGANKIDFDVHTTEDGSLVVVALDDGAGMSSEDKKKCKIPGKTTKRRDLDDPNFGIGWKSALAEFCQIRFTTSRGGKTAEVLLFTNSKDGVLVQEDVIEGDFKPGTMIEMIKDPVPYPLVDFIQMKARCYSRARHMEGIDILFQGEQVNVEERVKSKVSISEPLHVKGSVTGQATVQIGLWDEGIYTKKIKMAPVIPEKYLKLLPDLLKQTLQCDGARLRIFLPHQEQIFNRSLLTDEESILPQVQKMVLKAACDYLAACWLEGKHLNLLSNEYWYMYEVKEKSPSKSVETLYNKEDRHGWLKLQLLTFIQNHFQQKPQVQFPYACLSDKRDLAQLVVNVRLHDKANQKGETVKKRLDTPRSFLKFARRCPLKPNGLSLDSLCLKLKQSLLAKGILTHESYNLALVASKDLNELTQLLDSCLEEFRREYKTGYDPILRMFRLHTLTKLTNIKQEQIRKSQNPKDIPPALSVCLAHFLKSAAKTYLGKEIEIQFEEDPTGHAAHTHKGSNILWINSNSQLMQRYLSTFAHKGTAQEAELVPIAAEWLELLAHEATHMDDDSDCYNLHDAQFYAETAHRIERMFTKPGSGRPNGYELFLDALAK